MTREDRHRSTSDVEDEAETETDYDDTGPESLPGAFQPGAAHTRARQEISLAADTPTPDGGATRRAATP